MSETGFFRDQHDDLQALASTMLAHLHVDELSKDASKVNRLLTELASQLKVHLIMEDHTLYSKLLEHRDERIRSTASRLYVEMDSLGKAVAAHKKQWPNALQIQKHPAEFIAQTRAMMDLLIKRIDMENSELYKLVDEL